MVSRGREDLDMVMGEEDSKSSDQMALGRSGARGFGSEAPGHCALGGITSHKSIVTAWTQLAFWASHKEKRPWHYDIKQSHKCYE
jgi:hypothetical protein